MNENESKNSNDACFMVEDGYFSEQFIKQLSGDFDISCVIHIKAKNSGIENMGCVYMCEHLISLDVSHNKIADLTPLYKLASLQTLNLSNNNITSLKGLENMPALTSLNLSGNQIANYSELKPLETVLQLKKLILRDGNLGNPICHHQAYKQKITSLLPDLTMLDYRYLKGDLCSVFKRLDAIDEYLKEEKVTTHDLPPCKPLVSSEFWEEEFFDDLELQLKIRYLKETVNSVYVEKYQLEEKMELCLKEDQDKWRRISAELRTPRAREGRLLP